MISLAGKIVLISLLWSTVAFAGYTFNVKLEWLPQECDFFTVYTLKDNETESQVDEGITDNSFTIKNLSPGLYQFFVSASNKYGESDLSERALINVECPSADLNNDGVVDAADYAIFTKQYLQTCKIKEIKVGEK